VESPEIALHVNSDVHIPGQTAEIGFYITEKGKRDMTEREHEEEHYAIWLTDTYHSASACQSA